MNARLKIAYILSGILAIGEIYFGNRFVDFVLVPAFLMSIYFSLRGGLRARFIWLGLLLFFFTDSLYGIIFYYGHYLQRASSLAACLFIFILISSPVSIVLGLASLLKVDFRSRFPKNILFSLSLIVFVLLTLQFILDLLIVLPQREISLFYPSHGIHFFKSDILNTIYVYSRLASNECTLILLPIYMFSIFSIAFRTTIGFITAIWITLGNIVFFSVDIYRLLSSTSFYVVGGIWFYERIYDYADIYIPYLVPISLILGILLPLSAVILAFLFISRLDNITPRQHTCK
jgi:hypothetical protein